MYRYTTCTISWPRKIQTKAREIMLGWSIENGGGKKCEKWDESNRAKRRGSMRL